MSRALRIRATALAAFLALAVALAAAPGAGAATLPSGFSEQTVFSGLHEPVNFKFAPDGRVFVGEKSGKILVYSSLDDPTPEVFANLAEPVYDFEDHGLLGLALDPKFDEGRPYVYALYTFNHKLANKATQTHEVTNPREEPLAYPEYNGPGEFENDKCPEGEAVAKKEKAREDPGCEVSGLLVRLTAEGDHASPSAAEPTEEVLLEGWCQQSTTHSVGDLGFGPEGALFVSGGEGAMFSEPDYGQFGNVCEDPPETTNPNPERLKSEGGSLRSQSVLRDHNEPDQATLLSGTLLRINPNTGAPWPGNPFAEAGQTEPNAKRIFGFGFRNPWRFAFNDRTGHLFISNVGNGHFEEMDRVALGEGTAYNSGWPCYEGGVGQVSERNLEYVGSNPSFWNDACKPLFEAEDNDEPATDAPFFAYPHSGAIAPKDPCIKPYTDIAGLAFYEGETAPAYSNSLIFSDAIRGCLYRMSARPNGEPDPSTVEPFLTGTPAFSFPGVDIEQGPEGNLYYSEFGSEYLLNKLGSTSGAVKRIVFPDERPAPPEPPQPPAPPTPAPEPTSNPSPAPAPAPPPATPQPPQIKGRPGKKTTQRTAKFVFSGEAGVRFRCKIDNKSFASCKSPRTYKNLKPGKHTFRVYSATSAGARLSANRVFDWQIVKSS
jgi:glucose/arabinose dehydrogenase